MDERWITGRAPEEPDTVLIGSNGIFFARVVGSPGSPAESRARLMAAAPDLLAAGQALLGWAEAAEEQIEGERGDGRSLEQMEAAGTLASEILAMRAAIAKATQQEGTA
jgi:hypothetical protein